MKGRGQDEGAATLYAVGVGVLFVLLGLAVALRGSALVDQSQARTAADLGALAGAVRASQGQAAACAMASEVAIRNGAAVVRCILSGLDLSLIVKVGSAVVSARAGPIRSMDDHFPAQELAGSNVTAVASMRVGC